MSGATAFRTVPHNTGIARLVSLALAGLLAGGCSSLGDAMPELVASNMPAKSHAVAPEGADARSDLLKATEYWRKEYQKKPQDLDAALSYAKNLKALGEKGQALGVLQQAALYHSTDRRLASEYGRLALQLDQVTVADKLLRLADDPTSPDWRVISARGTVLAKQGKYADAIKFFERANTLSSGRPSVMNNLALAHAMNGDAQRAEGLLRTTAAKGKVNPKVRQNLALVLSLQGKYEESTKIASAVLPPAMASSNTALLRKIVKLEPKAMPKTAVTAPVAVAAAKAPQFKPAVLKAAKPAPAVARWSTRVASSEPKAEKLPWQKRASSPAARVPAKPAVKPASSRLQLKPTTH